jgi:hypothetical protein
MKLTAIFIAAAASVVLAKDMIHSCDDCFSIWNKCMVVCTRSLSSSLRTLTIAHTLYSKGVLRSNTTRSAEIGASISSATLKRWGGGAATNAAPTRTFSARAFHSHLIQGEVEYEGYLQHVSHGRISRNLEMLDRVRGDFA